MENIKVPTSPGELLDKITILEIKMEQISDAEKLKHIEYELEQLTQIWNEHFSNNEDLDLLKKELRETNTNMWDIEDNIRIKESKKEFDNDFIELARSVYYQNDKRANTKKKINELLGSLLMEEKSYADYQ